MHNKIIAKNIFILTKGEAFAYNLYCKADWKSKFRFGKVNFYSADC